MDYEHVHDLADRYVLGDLRQECLKQGGIDIRSTINDTALVKELSFDYLKVSVFY